MIQDLLITINIERIGCVEGFTPPGHVAFADAVYKHLGAPRAISYNGDELRAQYERAGLRENNVFHSQCHALCIATGQDCIAVVTHDLLTGYRHQHLIGPRAHQWLPFRPDLFHYPEGAQK